MSRTSVPEAAVDEYGYFRAGEDDVCASSKSRQYLAINAIAKAKTMQLLAEG